jgi:hypothetical protein
MAADPTLRVAVYWHRSARPGRLFTTTDINIIASSILSAATQIPEDTDVAL